MFNMLGKIVVKYLHKQKIPIEYCLGIIVDSLKFGITIIMQRREIYFFGKLNQSRDFIVSDNLGADDKNFWDGWLGRCGNQDRLIPFTRKAFTAPRIWLFCIKFTDNTAYAGIIAPSADKTGRQYPFVLFCKSASCFDLRDQFEFISEKKDFFSEVLEKGKCVIDNCHTGVDDIKKSILPEPFLRYLSNSSSEGSFWLDSESGRYIEHEGLLSCSLFNKLFGS